MNNFNFNLIDTSKGLGPFTYSWNQDGTLSGIQYPNNTNLNITYCSSPSIKSTSAYLTDNQGNVIVGYLYDLNNGSIKSEYNPQEIDNPYKGGGKEGSLTFSVDSSTNIILDLIGNDYIISNPWGNAADGGATTNGEGEFELLPIETGGFCFMFVGDRVFIPNGGYAMDCESYIRNGDKLGQDIVNYFKGEVKTDSEIKDIEGIVGYCCNCSGGFAAKYMPDTWINQNHTTEEGENIGCQTGTKIRSIWTY